jgi:hypothetical protein
MIKKNQEVLKATTHDTPRALKVVINNDTVYSADNHIQSEDVEGLIIESLLKYGTEKIISEAMDAVELGDKLFTLTEDKINYLLENLSNEELLELNTLVENYTNLLELKTWDYLKHFAGRIKDTGAKRKIEKSLAPTKKAAEEVAATKFTANYQLLKNNVANARSKILANPKLTPQQKYERVEAIENTLRDKKAAAGVGIGGFMGQKRAISADKGVQAVNQQIATGKQAISSVRQGEKQMLDYKYKPEVVAARTPEDAFTKLNRERDEAAAKEQAKKDAIESSKNNTMKYDMPAYNDTFQKAANTPTISYDIKAATDLKKKEETRQMRQQRQADKEAKATEYLRNRTFTRAAGPKATNSTAQSVFNKKQTMPVTTTSVPTP